MEIADQSRDCTVHRALGSGESGFAIPTRIPTPVPQVHPGESYVAAGYIDFAEDNAIAPDADVVGRFVSGQAMGCNTVGAMSSTALVPRWTWRSAPSLRASAGESGWVSSRVMHSKRRASAYCHESTAATAVSWARVHAAQMRQLWLTFRCDPSRGQRDGGTSGQNRQLYG